MEEPFRGTGFGFIAERFEGWVEEFIDDSGDRGFDGIALAGIEVREFSVEAIQFGAADFAPVFAEPVDDRSRSAVVDFVNEGLCLRRDDLVGAGNFCAAGLTISFAGFFECIEVVEEDVVVEGCDGGVEVARGGEVEDEDGLFSGTHASGGEALFGNERLRGAGGAYDNIRQREPVIEFGEINSVAAEFFGEQFSAFAAAVGDDEILYAFGLEINECFLGHFTGADDEHKFVVEATEDTAGKIADGDAGDGDASVSQSRFGANLSRNFEGSLEEDVGERSAGLIFLSDAIGFLDLVYDLGFSEDHAVDAAGDLEEVFYGVGAAECAECRGKFFGGDVMDAAEEADQVVSGKAVSGLFIGGVDFDAIAGGKNDEFGAGVSLFPAVVGDCEVMAGGEGQTFADLDAGAMVTAAEGEHVHGVALELLDGAGAGDGAAAGCAAWPSRLPP